MKQHILLLEDDAVQARKLTNTIKSYSIELQVSYAMTLTQATRLLESETIFHAFFLDISLDTDRNNQAGLQLAEQIRSISRYQRTPIFFITAFPENIRSALNQFHCFAYIVKPYSVKEIHQQLDALFKRQSTLLLKTTDNIHIRISLDSVQYIQSHGRYLTFVTTSSSYCSRQYTLKQLKQLLPDKFVRCHKSYIINQMHVDNYDFLNHFAHMKKNNEIIPLSRDFRL